MVKIEMAVVRKIGRNGWQGLLAVAWALAIVLSAATSQAADLTVDGGATYTVNANIAYANEVVGQNTSGAINQSGFSNNINRNLILGWSSGSSGTYNLSGGSLSASVVEVIGLYGVGTFNQSGGSNQADFLQMGINSGSNGTYNLSGGSLSARSQTIGSYGVGIFNQSGGSNQADFQTFGEFSGSNGTYNLSSGSNNTIFLDLGLFSGGIGTFNQSGGSNLASGLTLGVFGGSGIYNLSGGSLSANVQEIGWGIGADGTFNQSGGSNQADYLVLGSLGGSSGTYNLVSGSLVAAYQYIGEGGVGIFKQSGGSNQTGLLYLGRGPGSSGTYNLSGGSLNAGGEYIGNYGLGTFNQSGGVNQTHGIVVGGGYGSGTYNLSGGSLIIDTRLTIGWGGGVGAFNQSGGSNQTDGLIVGGYLGFGTYNLNGGNLSSYFQNIGASGVGSFNQNGGSNQTNYLLLGMSDSSGGNWLQGVGTYNLSGGNLTVGDEAIGRNGSGSFLQTGGVHTVTGNLTLASDPGSRGSLALLGGTLTVGGNYTQNASGSLALGIASASNYQRINIGGTASLNGTLTPVLLGYLPRVNQVYSGVLTAAGGLTGTFTLTNPWIGPTLYWQQRYHANSLDLLVARDYNNPGLGLNSNQAAVGAMLNGLAGTTSGDLGGVLNAIDNLGSPSDVAGAFQQISPDKAASLATLGFAGAGLFRRGLANRITNLRYGGMGGAGGPGGLGSFNLNYSGASGLMLAYNSSSLAGLITAKKKAAPETRWGVYLDPGLALGSQKSSSNQTGYNFTIAGFNAGADYRVRDDLLVGLASGYSHTGAAFRGSGGAVENHTWPLTAYAAYLPEPFYAYGSLGYALNLFSLERNLSFGGLSRVTAGSPTGHQFNAYGEAGYDVPAGSLVMTPLVSLAYSNLWVNAFTESGAGALNLQVDSQQADSLQTGVGAKIAVPLQRNGVTVAPQVYATYQHEFSNRSRGLNARLSQGGSAFAFQSAQLGQDFAVLGASVTLMTRKNFSLHLDYNTEVGRKNYTTHFVNAGLRYEF